MRIIQGTTPTISVEVTNLPIESATAIELTFKSGDTVTRKGLEDVTIEGNTISYHFTQEETLAFSAAGTLYWQLRVMVDGEVYGIPIQNISVLDLISEVVLE